MTKLYLLAEPGERHEDVTPYGLYTAHGLAEVCLQLQENISGDYVGYYVFIMKPNQQWKSSRSCDFVINLSKKDIYIDGSKIPDDKLADFIGAL